MYSVSFQKDNGETFLLGKDNNIVFDIDGLSGLPVDIGTSQGAAQVGESVETQSVNGKTLTVKGYIFNEIQSGKRKLLKYFSAFQSGKLFFGNYYIYVYVQESPTVSPIKNNGTFTMLLFAPYPFFRKTLSTDGTIGAVTPQFSFPVTYSSTGTHSFGLRASVKYANFVNSGDVEIPFSVTISADSESTNPTLTNLITFEKLAINGTLNTGDILRIYRTENGVLKANLTSGGIQSDAMSMIDEESDLWYLHVGDNLINISDDEGSANVLVTIEYNEAISGVYEE